MDWSEFDRFHNKYLPLPVKAKQKQVKSTPQ